ncbi:MAG TPA: hypothetical protein VH142_08865 [Polyangiaceae bacterium]|jgi:hypothetical protein|nr:hypothetical protein [Polyangiaceae bacterium]
MNAVQMFVGEFRKDRARAVTGMAVEYATFAAAVSLAATLYATRAPMALLDRRLGLRLRERFVDAIARISPG